MGEADLEVQLNPCALKRAAAASSMAHDVHKEKAGGPKESLTAAAHERPKDDSQSTTANGANRAVGGREIGRAHV